MEHCSGGTGTRITILGAIGTDPIQKASTVERSKEVVHGAGDVGRFVADLSGGAAFIEGGAVTELFHRVGEEADGAGAGSTFLAELGAVLGGVEPAFEDAMGVGAVVTTTAGALQLREV